MANKYEFIKATFDDTLKQITKSSDSWQAFLTSACRNFKLPFEEQVLIYAQRPDATAVLPFDTWNKRFGRRINTGATGIAVLDEREGRAQKLKYYFDISDTRENEFSKPVPIWVYQDAYEGDVITTLEDNFGELAVKYDIIDAATSAAQNIAADNLPDYSRELIRYFKSGSLLEELPDDIIESEFRALVEKSVAYMMLTRLGIAPDEYFEPEDFQNVFDFNTPDAISALGTATSDLAQMGLSEIGKTVLSLQRQNRTFAPTQQSEYTKAEKQDKEIHFGRYAEMHRKYLKEHHKPYYTSLKMQCKLDSHLSEIQTRATEMESRLMRQMAKQEGLTETLKAQNMMEWVQGMNNLKSRVQEIVMTEVIYQR